MGRSWGVVGPLPHIQGPGGVEDGVVSEDGPDAAGHRFDVVDGDHHLWVVTHHAFLLSVMLSTGRRSVGRTEHRGEQPGEVL
jgi:hypothetical protein